MQITSRPSSSSNSLWCKPTLLCPVRTHPGCRQQSWVAQAKLTKASEFRELSAEDINKEIYDCQRALLDQRIAQSTRKTFKRDIIRWNKHKVAQLKTVLREREIEQGITPRESRKLEKNKRLAAGFGQY